MLLVFIPRAVQCSAHTTPRSTSAANIWRLTGPGAEMLGVDIITNSWFRRYFIFSMSARIFSNGLLEMFAAQ